MYPIILTALAALLPLASADCTAASLEGFSWTLDGFFMHASYIFTTPAHQNSVGTLGFNLTNPAVPFTAVCSAESLQLDNFFYGNIQYSCAAPAGAPAGAGVTNFTYSWPGYSFTVNQSWTCPESGATFTGYASLTLPLTCNETDYTNPNWTEGQIYSDREVQCGPVTLPVTPYKLVAIEGEI